MMPVMPQGTRHPWPGVQENEIGLRPQEERGGMFSPWTISAVMGVCELTHMEVGG